MSNLSLNIRFLRIKTMNITNQPLQTGFFSNKITPLKPQKFNKADLFNKNIDTLTIAFKGSSKQSKEWYETKLRPLEAILFNKNINSNVSKQLMTMSKLSSLLEKAIDNDIKLDLDAEKYIKQSQSILTLSKNHKDEDDIAFIAANFLVNAYDMFDDPSQLRVEEIFFNILLEDKDTACYRHAETFFDAYDNHMDPDVNNIFNTIGEIEELGKTQSKKYFQLREKLFLQEVNLLTQEIFEPEKHIDRAIKMRAIDLNKDEIEGSELDIKLNALSGLYSLLNTFKDLKINLKPFDCKKIATNLFNDLAKEKDSDYIDDIEISTLEVLTTIYNELKPDQKEKVEQLALKCMDAGFFKDYIKPSNPSYKSLEQKLATEFYDDQNDLQDKITVLIGLITLESDQGEHIITQLLEDPSTDKNLRQVAIWALGAYKTEKNLDSLVKIIESDPDNTNVQTALFSLVEYKSPKVTNTLKTIAKNKPIFNSLAKTLLDKVEKRYSKTNDYVLKQFKLSPSEEKKYIELRDQYIKSCRKLSNKEINWIDKTLLPFRSLLQQRVCENKHLVILNDTVTSQMEERDLRLNNGQFYETTTGVCHEDQILITNPCFKTPDDSGFTFAHEWGHTILNYLEENDPDKYDAVCELFENATKKDQFMDSYAATTVDEYFAQGNEAYISSYKPHSKLKLIDNFENIDANTKHLLKGTDPELFEFIHQLYNEFNNIPLTKMAKPLNIVA